MTSPFDVRATIECGWNVFLREGDSEDPRTISANTQYLNHLKQAGLNSAIVFWANTRGFDHAWAQAVPHAHSIGLKLGRAIYGFAAGPYETPGLPERLLRAGKRGPRTAICPHEPEAREWLLGMTEAMLVPDVDIIDIEPGRHTYRRCLCAACSAMNPYEWDVFTTNMIAERILRTNPRAEIWMHVFVDCFEGAGAEFRQAYGRLNPRIRHIFGWEADNEAAMERWLSLDPRFEHFAKLGRVLLFPDGRTPATPAAERVARIFRWSRTSAEKGKKGYLFDYRIFGGMEWQMKDAAGFKMPVTRRSDKIPASIAVMGAAMNDPYMDDAGQRSLLARLRWDADWDLDDPAHFWKGKA